MGGERMLSDYTLDTEGFQDIMEEAKNMVVSLYPEWTDFNYHDPGITMLELFSWIKEGQQYFLDQIGVEHKKKYLKLLGMFLQHRKAAHAFVHINTKEDFILQKRTKFSAGAVCFEAEREQCIIHNSIIQCFHGNEQLEHECVKEHLKKNEILRVLLFGEEPQKGDAFYIGFERELPIKETIGIYIQLEKGSGIQRKQINTPLFFPMLKLKYEYFTNGTWKAVEEVADTTFGMLQNGMIYFCMENNMTQTEVFERTAYYIRIRIEESDIDSPPILKNIQLNMVSVTQKDTLAEYEKTTFWKKGEKCCAKSHSYLCMAGQNDIYIKMNQIYYHIPVYEKFINSETGEVEFIFDMPKTESKEIMIVSYSDNPKVKKCIGIGNGFPYQEYDLHTTAAIDKQLELLVHEIGSRGGYSHWKRVNDFGASKPEDRHFIVDSQEGKIIFGDCEHGMAPEGKIIMISFAETLGGEGNVKKGKINRFTDVQPADIMISNPADAYGGKNEESLEACFLRARKKLKHPDTAVTYEDYERYVKETPGLMIESCKVIPANEANNMQEKREENMLFIVVKPAGLKQNQELSQSYKKNILAHLEPYRMIGTKINIISPRYILMELCLGIVTKAHFLNVKERIHQVVTDYFEKLSKNFGAAIVYSELYGIIDMLECVEGINEITLDIKDRTVTRMQDGSVILPPNGVVELKDVQYLLTLSD